jgi:hypothetical protein
LTKSFRTNLAPISDQEFHGFPEFFTSSFQAAGFLLVDRSGFPKYASRFIESLQ